jgi:Uma2 family endonuclease
MAAEPRSLISREAYLAMECESEERHEYIAGEVIHMPSGNHDHALILGNLIGALHRPTRERGYWLFSRDLRLAIPAADVYTYTDTSIVCEETKLEDAHRDNLLNPTVLIEVCAPATEAYDRGRKFHFYQRIPSFKEYLLIALDAPVVDHCVRQRDNRWLCATIEGIDASIALPSLDYSLALSDIYDGVTLG